MVTSSSPSARPAPKAASALRTLNRPGSAISTVVPSIVKVEPSPSTRRPSGRSVALRSSAYVIAAGKCGRELCADRIVDVEHLARREIEQLALRCDVAFEGAVKIEVVARDVGQHRGRKADVVDALQRQRVRGDFHRDGRRAGGAHLRQQRVQVERQRGRVSQRPGRVVAKRPAQRSDHAARDPRGLEHVADQVGRRRLPVGPGDADDGERC
jgi:hypothetical protein